MSHDFDVVTGESAPAQAEHAETGQAQPPAEAGTDASGELERGRHA